MKEAEELKKLDPIARIRKLKELLEQKNKELLDKNKEIDEAKNLSVQAEREREDIIALQEKIKVPGIEEIDVPGLFEKKDEAKLEERVALPPGQPSSNETDEHLADASQYNIPVPTGRTPAVEMYADMLNVYSSAVDRGTVTPGMAYLAGALQDAFNRKQDDINSGFYTANDEVIKQANAAKAIADKILALYSGSGGKKIKDGVHLWP